MMMHRDVVVWNLPLLPLTLQILIARYGGRGIWKSWRKMARGRGGGLGTPPRHDSSRALDLAVRCAGSCCPTAHRTPSTNHLSILPHYSRPLLQHPSTIRPSCPRSHRPPRAPLIPLASPA
ncbi:hypothetical protein C8R45DRAFT_575110 [Mycena sanguinolenta]|nr:hypothetical protein C8R45DRAFT_575110 [Mycena sanguinolenta]